MSVLRKDKNPDRLRDRTGLVESRKTQQKKSERPLNINCINVVS